MSHSIPNAIDYRVHWGSANKLAQPGGPQKLSDRSWLTNQPSCQLARHQVVAPRVNLTSRVTPSAIKRRKILFSVSELHNLRVCRCRSGRTDHLAGRSLNKLVLLRATRIDCAEEEWEHTSLICLFIAS